MNADDFDLSSVMFQLFEHATESIALVDTDGRVLFVNRVSEVYNGKTIEETRGNLIWEVFPDTATPVFEEHFHRAVREQVPVSFEFYFPPTDKWLELRFYPSPNAVAIFSAEITERKRASETIRVERERLQKTLNAANIGTWRWDFSTNLFVADALTMAFFDVTPEQIALDANAPFSDRIHPDDIDRVKKALERATNFAELYEQTHRVIYADGSIHWLIGRGKLEYDLEGHPIALIGTTINVTTQKQAEEALRQSEEKYRHLIENVDQGYCLCEMIWDAEGRPSDYRYLEVNPAFEGMTGLVNAAGKTSCEMIPGIEIFWAEHYGEILRTGEPIHIQHGSEAMGRVFDVFAAPSGGNRFVVLFTDITEKVRRERENEALNERLRRAMQETHHRVKNNLQVIASLVDMQAAEVENETVAAPLHRINQHIQALAVIHDLLTHQAKGDEDTEHLGTWAVSDKLVPLLRNTIGARNIVANIEDVILTAQKAASFALLVNECVSNAIKHSSAGQIEITLKRENEGNRARLEICDDGEGFPADFNPRRDANTGLQLIESAARWDLQGDVRYDNHGLGGGRVVVTFPIEVTSPPNPLS